MYNKVFLAGYLNEEVKLQNTVNQIPFARFNLTIPNTSSYYSSNVNIVPCTIWRQNAINFIEMVKKDNLVVIEGRLRGQNNFLEVTATGFQILTGEKATDQPVNQTKTPTSKLTEEKKGETKSPDEEKKPDQSLGIDWGDLKPKTNDDQNKQ